jgi:hypothetical protein
MKYFAIFIVLSLQLPTAFAEGGCLQDKELNRAFEVALKIRCDNFPELIGQENGHVWLRHLADVVLAEKDAARLVRYAEINFANDDTQNLKSFKLSVKGKIKLPALKNLEVSNIFKTIDLHEAQLNLPALEELQIPFFDGLFPAFNSGKIQAKLRKLKLTSNSDLTLRTDDFSSLKDLESLILQGDDSFPDPVADIILEGDINLPKLKILNVLYCIRSIDASKGSFKTPPLIQLQILYSKDFPRFLERKIITEETDEMELRVNSGEVHFDFAGVKLGKYVEIHGATSISNLHFNGDRLAVEALEGAKTEMKGLEFSGERLELSDVYFSDFLKPFTFSDNGQLILKGVKCERELLVPNMKLLTLEITNSRIRLPSSTDFTNLGNLAIKNSMLDGVILPKNMSLYECQLVNAKATLQGLPNFSKVTYIYISGQVTILEERPVLDVTTRQESIFIDLPEASRIQLKLSAPENLINLYFFSSDENPILVSGEQNASKLPASFKMVVRQKKEVMRLRKLLGRKSVAFTDETY